MAILLIRRFPYSCARTNYPNYRVPKNHVKARRAYVAFHAIVRPMKAVACVLGLAILVSPVFVSAGHKLYVGNTIITPEDRGIYQEHGANCPYRHYHGELNGVADPAPDGCGHGEVKIIVHGDGDGETIPPPPKKGFWAGVGEWFDSWFTKENAKNVVDVAAESNGIPPPFQTAETVDIVVDAAPAIKEKIDGIKEYRETAGEDDTLGIYTAPTSGGNADGSDTLSQKFFKWINSW